MQVLPLTLPLLLAGTLLAQCPHSLGTLTNGNTSFGVGGGNFFDVAVTNPLGIHVCAIDTKTTAAVGTPITVDIYVTPGTYVGVGQNPTPWRLIASGTGTGTGSLQPPVPITLARPFYLPAGSYGMFVQLTSGGGPQYTQGTNTFSNADLTLTLGASQSTRFSSALATPRTWNGVFYYSTCATGGEASYGLFGLGCAGSLPVAEQRHQSRPVRGQALNLTIDNLPLAAAVMVVGLSNTVSGFGQLPLELSQFGAPGCFSRTSVDATTFLVGSGNTAAWTFGIPNNPILQCQQFYTQALVVDPAFNALNAVVSDAHAGIIGN